MSYYGNALQEWFLRKKISVLYQEHFISGHGNLFPAFFILSPGRSGSTLLRRLLIEVPELVIPPESGDAIPSAGKAFLKRLHSPWDQKVKGMLDAFFARRDLSFWDMDRSMVQKRLEDLSEDEKFFDRAISELYEAYAQAWDPSSAKMVGDKTPFLIFRMEWLKLFFPQALFIFLIRDGRDVVQSMIERRGRDFETACGRWALAMDLIEKERDHSASNSLLLRYEDLVKDPKGEVEKILHALGLPHSTEKIDPSAGIQRELGDTVLAHHVKAKEAVDPSKIDEWKFTMSSERQDAIEKKLGDRLRKWGYKRVFE